MHLPTPNPIAFHVLGFDIRWYGILIAFGMLIALYISYIRAPRFQIKDERIIDFALISIPIGIIGARLYYVLFNWDYYRGDFFKMIDIRSGGLAIHGGLIFGLLAATILCYYWSIRPLNLMDLVVPSIALAQSIGRWGNYFNQEAHGGPTDLPWAIEINGEMVHPTFLYESIWCFVIFLVLLFWSYRRTFTGQIFLLYGLLYSLERFFVEQLRTDSLMVGSLKVAQLLSGGVFLVFLILYFFMNKKYSRRNRMFY